MLSSFFIIQSFFDEEFWFCSANPPKAKQPATKLVIVKYGRLFMTKMNNDQLPIL